MADWVRFHRELNKGAKRGLPRATRYVYMELSLEARPGRGRIELPREGTLVSAIHDLIGGNRRELTTALRQLLDGKHSMVVVEETATTRVLVIPTWEAWNANDTSTKRVRAFRERQKGSGNGNETFHSVSPETAGNALEERRVDQRVTPKPPNGGSAQVPPQLELVGEPPPSPPPKPKPKRQRGERPAWEGYAAAYAEGMSEAAGQPFAAPRQRTDLVQMARTFAVGRDGGKLTGDELVAWFRATAAEYRRRTEPRFERYDPAGCLRWLNAGRPDKRDRPPAARGAPNVQPAPATGSIYDCKEF